MVNDELPENPAEASTEELLTIWRYSPQGRLKMGDPRSEAIRAEIFKRQQENMADWERASDTVGWQKLPTFINERNTHE